MVEKLRGHMCTMLMLYVPWHLLYVPWHLKIEKYWPNSPLPKQNVHMRKAANREYLQLVWFWFIHNIFASAMELCPVDEMLMMRFSLCALWETDALMAVSMCNVSPLQTKPTSPDMKSQWGRKNLHHTWATPMSLKSYKNVRCLFQGSELSHNLFTEHHIVPWLLVACAL